MGCQPSLAIWVLVGQFSRGQPVEQKNNQRKNKQQNRLLSLDWIKNCEKWEERTKSSWR
jgi:hypothetical protein